MRWSVTKRIEFIEARLFWEGKISRKDLTAFFEISIPQATKDLKEYSEIAPNNIEYDSSSKHYVATPVFDPVVSSPSSEKYLTRLKFLVGEKFFNGIIPPFSELPRLRRFVSTEILRDVLLAINNKKAIEINYQSMRLPNPKTRWITPHSFGYDGSRWHVRSLCHNDSFYKDFNLGRILSISESSDHIFDHSVDYEFHNEIGATIAPHPELEAGPKSCIERDYCMQNGQITFNIKASFFNYFKLSLGFRDDHKDIPCNEQQIILLNHDEMKTKIDLLQSMTKAKIKELLESGTYKIKTEQSN